MEGRAGLRSGVMTIPGRPTKAWAVGFWCAVFALQAWRVRGPLLDDAFILFRYAAHIGSGYGPVWNAGEAPTEGYTSFLYVLGMALPARLGWDLPACAFAFGLFCALGSIFLVYQGVRAAGGGARAAHIGCGLFALNPFLVQNATSGMETPLYILLILGSFYFAVRGVTSSVSHWYAAFGLGFLATLARPEGALFAIVLAAAGWGWLAPDRRRTVLKAFALGAVLPGAVYMAWRLWTFGHLLPNPFYVKQGGGLFSRAGTAYVLRFVFPASFPFLLLLLKRLADEAARRTVTFSTGTVCAVLTALLGFYCTVDPLMGEGFRFLTPLLPLLFVACAPEVDAAVHWGAHRLFRPVFFAMFVGYAYLSHPVYLRDAVLGRPPSPEAPVAVEARLGKALTPLRTPERSVAWGDAGALAYYSRWRFLDIAGLNDNFIARSRNYPLREVVRYIFDQAPTLIVIPTERGTGPDAASVFRRGHGPHGHEVYQALLKHPEMDGYGYVVTFETATYDLNLFVRRDTDSLEVLTRALREAGGKVLEQKRHDRTG